jgi:hypothetical protein
MKRRFLILVVLLTVCLSAMAEIHYRTKLSSGPFLVTPTAASVDWAVVNNDHEAANVRVTVYKLDLSGPKVAIAPGPVTFNLAPDRTFHNANAFDVGFYYEVVVESTSDKVCPAVEQWSNTAGAFIPGTLIPAGEFVKISKDHD